MFFVSHNWSCSPTGVGDALGSPSCAPQQVCMESSAVGMQHLLGTAVE